MGDEKLLKLETRIENLMVDRESKNGNKYTALVLPSGDWVFVWDGDWKDEVEKFAQTYRNLEVDLYVVDREDDPNDHFYNLKAVLPKDPEVNEKLFRAKKKTADTSEDTKSKAKERFDEVYN